MGFDLPLESEAMRCVICKQGDTAVLTTTVTLERGDTVLVIRDVPADVCTNCGEAYVGEDVAVRLLEDVEAAVRDGIEIDIRRYAA